MLTARPAFALRRFLAVSAPKNVRALSAPATTKKDDDDEDGVSVVTQRRQEMKKENKFMVWGQTGEHMPAPVLPEDPTELVALDPADLPSRMNMDGTERTVIIRQDKQSMRQSPLNPEKIWRIAFYEDGKITEKWTNPLMGWTSNADPYQCAPPLVFPNAADAAYFAKKRGWKFIVKQPIPRFARRDDAQYQDNFLPQAVAAQIQKEGAQCDHWHRTSSGSSHYFRPLTYHGDGIVRQHGTSPAAKTLPHVEGYYKIR
jgi:hypothetical protein